MFWFSLSGSNIFEQSLGKITMTTLSLREQLRLQIESLPDDFHQWQISPPLSSNGDNLRTYADQFQRLGRFSLAQFFVKR